MLVNSIGLIARLINIKKAFLTLLFNDVQSVLNIISESSILYTENYIILHN